MLPRFERSSVNIDDINTRNEVCYCVDVVLARTRIKYEVVRALSPVEYVVDLVADENVGT